MTGGKEGDKEMRMKKVIGVAAVITVIMAVVLIVFSCTVSAESVNRTYTDDGGVLWYEGAFISPTKPKDAGNKPGFYEGEEIRFWNKSLSNFAAVKVSGPYKSDGNIYDEYDEYDVSAGDFWDTEGKPTKGYFKVVDADEHGGWFSLNKQSFSLKLEDTKVREKESFNLTLKKYLLNKRWALEMHFGK